MLALHVTGSVSTLCLLCHSYYLDRDEQVLGCKPRRSLVSGKFGVQANMGYFYANLRRSEEDLGSEVVFRMDVAWSIDFGPHWF